MIHISTSVEGLLRLSDYRLNKMARHIIVDGKPLKTARQARSLLKKMLKDGQPFIPASECDNYDSRGLCMGHENRSTEGKING